MTTIEWTEAGPYTDIEYHKAEGIAKSRSIAPRSATPSVP